MNQKQKKNQIIPLSFVLKYEPPTIGLVYKDKQNKKKVYNILLQDLIYLEDEVDITEMLFAEHPKFLDPAFVEPKQVLQLVQKLIDWRNAQFEQQEAFIEDSSSDSGVMEEMENIIDDA
ncbi:hypothetical protein pb186bvf_018716 [Paramecium bursaria]